jgi:putative transcriptional regulator
MTINHHLDDATLMSFAAGSLPETLAAAAAAHVSMCKRCSREIHLHEHVGAALVQDIAPAELKRSTPEVAEAMGDDEVRAPSPAAIPLERLLGGSLDDVRWRWIGPGLWHRPLRAGGHGTLQLIKAAPGARVPEHTHGGGELTLVLQGALVDETGIYGPGDVADLDESVAHNPVADESEGCVCLIANEQPTRFRGVLARIMQRWHGL